VFSVPPVVGPWLAAYGGQHTSNEVAEALRDWLSSPQVPLDIVDSGPAEERDFSLGPPSAAVTIVEFSDFECPFCEKAAVVIKSIISRYPDTVRFVFKNYPIDAACHPRMTRGGHQYACEAAKMVRCAGAQGEEFFWLMHDELLSADLSNRTLFDSILGSLGLESEEFQRCMSDTATERRVVRDIEAGDAAGVSGTPAVFVNNKLVRFRSLRSAPLVLEEIIKHILTKG